MKESGPEIFFDHSNGTYYFRNETEYDKIRSFRNCQEAWRAKKRLLNKSKVSSISNLNYVINFSLEDWGRKE